MAGAGGHEVGRISIRVLPDTDRFRAQLKSQLEEIEKSLKAAIQVDVDLDEGGVKAKFRGLMAELKAVGAKGVDINVDVDRSMLDKVKGALSGIGGGAGGGIPSIGGGDVSTLLIALAALAAAAPLVGVVATGLAAIPGLIASVGVPFAAIALGIDGIKAAASQLQAPFEHLKATMSGFTQAQFAPVFQQLAGIFPVLERSLPKVSQGVADLFQGFASTITSSGGMAQIESMIDNISKALTAAAPAVSLFTNGFLMLANSFSVKLPAISGWLTDLGAQFTNWVSKITADGSLSKAFDGLGATIKSIVSALTPLFQQGIDFMGDPEKIASLTATFEVLGLLLQGIVYTSGQFFEGLTAAAGLVKTAWEGANAVFASVLFTITTAVGSIVSTVSGIGSTLAAVWNGIPGAASAAWNAVVDAVRTALANAVTAVVQGVANIVSEVAAIGGKVTAAAGNLGSALVAAGTALMNGLLAGIRSGLESVLSFAGGIAAKIAAVKGPISYDKTVLTPNGQALMQGLQAGIEGGFQGVLDRARQLAGEISDAVNSGVGNIDVSGLQDKLKKQLAEIGLESDQLKVQINGTDDKSAKTGLKDQRSQLQAIKDQLNLQKDQLGYSDKYGDTLSKNDNILGDTLSKMVTAGSSFATANLKQFEGDLGIGGGALSAGLDQGLGYATQMLSKLASGAFGGGSKTEIHVNSVDEAMAAYRTQQNKQTLSYAGRR